MVTSDKLRLFRSHARKIHILMTALGNGIKLIVEQVFSLKVGMLRGELKSMFSFFSFLISLAQTFFGEDTFALDSLDGLYGVLTLLSKNHF